MPKGGGGRVRMVNRTEFGSSSVPQREVDKAVKAIGGRGSKAAQSARDFGQVARQYGVSESRGEVGPLHRMKSARWNRVMSQVEQVAEKAGVSPRTLIRASLRGMLSPAVLTEGMASRMVSGRVEGTKKFAQESAGRARSGGATKASGKRGKA